MSNEANVSDFTFVDNKANSTMEFVDSDRCYEIIEIEVLPQGEEIPSSSIYAKKKLQMEQTTNVYCDADCLFGCHQQISDNARKRINDFFQKKSEEKKLQFYDKFIVVKHLKKNEGQTENIQYHLPSVDGVTQVCKSYFLSTLDIPEQKLSSYFDCKHAKNSQRKSLTDSNLQEVTNHICGFFTDNELNVAKMYALYKKKSKNPVGIEAYKNIFNKFCEKIDETVLSLEDQYETDVHAETSEVNQFKTETDLYSSNIPETASAGSKELENFQHIFEAQAFNSKTQSDIDENEELYFEEAKEEVDIIDENLYSNNIEEANKNSQNNSAALPSSFDKIAGKTHIEEPLKNKSNEYEEETDEEFMGDDQSWGYGDSSDNFLEVSTQFSDRCNFQEKKQLSRKTELLEHNLPKKNEHSRKPLGPVCASNCLFECSENFNEKARQLLNIDFWKLTNDEKRNFLKTYIQRVDIKRRNQKCKTHNDPRKKSNYRYYFPLDGDQIRVCQFFFENTLAISKLAIRYYFKTYHKNNAEQSLPDPEKNSTFQMRIEEVQNHIKSFPQNITISGAKMYKFYKEIAENPVGIDTYRKHLKIIQKLSIESDSPDKPVSTQTEAENSTDFKATFESSRDSDDSFEESILPDDYYSSKRSRNPELWQQNVRKKLREKGLAYCNKDGIERPAKTVGPTCASSCRYRCIKNFSSQERQLVHMDFWNLTQKQKRTFYGTYVEIVGIKRRRSKCADPRKKQNYHYFLPLAGKPIRVCQFYFLKTLDISNATIKYYFENYHQNKAMDMPLVYPGRGRKTLSQKQIQNVENHIKSFPDDHTFSVAKMYDLYRTNIENAVGINVYRRIMKTLKEKSVPKEEETNAVSCKQIHLKDSKQNLCIPESAELSPASQKESDIENGRSPASPKPRKEQRKNKSTIKNSQIAKPNIQVLKTPCKSTCFHACTSKISKIDRKRIHANFWKLSKNERRTFYGNYVKTVDIKRRTKPCKLESSKQNAYSYSLPVAQKAIEVCQHYFLSTLAITEEELYTF